MKKRLKRIGWVPKCIKSNDKEDLGVWIGEVKDTKKEAEDAAKEIKTFNYDVPREFKIVPIFAEVE